MMANYEYLTVAECLRRNGYRHYCNGMKYLEQGLPAYARGSFIKAQMHYDKAEMFELSSDPIVSIASPIFEEFNKRIAVRIMGWDLGIDHG